MSERTPCNRCTLNYIERAAATRGATVSVSREKLADALKIGSDRSWYVVQESDRDEPSAWLAELTIGCCC